jgi:hypothetical protein
MAFEDDVKEYINNYVEGHLPSKDDMEKQFDIIMDEDLKKRITKEYYIARYVYKFFEGMKAQDELLDAEIRLQKIMFANIYEAIIHYILFELYKDLQVVIDLEYVKGPTEISIPKIKYEKLINELMHDGKKIKTYYINTKRRDKTKIRFDEKAETAWNIGLIDEELKDEIIGFYNLRNGIHLHAEIRKQIVWDLEMSKMSYWRIEKLVQQIKAKLIVDGKFA